MVNAMSESKCITDGNGDRHWMLDGKLHRTDGPAIIFKSGGQFWYNHGKLHRTDGPAAMYSGGTISWYFEGARLSLNEWLAITPLDEERKLLIKLQYG
jgi:hypothetical protein